MLNKIYGLIFTFIYSQEYRISREFLPRFLTVKAILITWINKNDIEMKYHNYQYKYKLHVRNIINKFLRDLLQNKETILHYAIIIK